MLPRGSVALYVGRSLKCEVGVGSPAPRFKSAMARFDDALPIDAVRGDIASALASGSVAVIVAPPGAGKTTRVPLWLAEASWLGDQRILVLEPRRLAARGAARRMAATLGEPVGGRVGLRARLVTQVSAATRIEVVTEGVFTRMILDDPSLEGIGAVLFDEFHERSLDADLGLAFALDAQRDLRPDLRIVPMSATIDAARVASLLGNAPVIACQGRTFPVETIYVGRDPRERIEEQMVRAILRALDAQPGSILAFLPGQGEIRRVGERLRESLQRRSDIDVAELFGQLDMADQDRAVIPAPPGRRKVVLATSIAETSLTIEGVRVVVDCGLSRVPRYEPQSGLTRLETVRVSRASADQRRGRAGRTEPGVCYRLWAEPETQSLPAHAQPEIRNADLSRLVIDCATWGVTEPSRLPWLDPPPDAALALARQELRSLSALDEGGRLTGLGRKASAFALPPRLALMVLRAAETGNAAAAAEIAAVLVERGLGGSDTDVTLRLSRFRSDRSRRAEGMCALARQWVKAAEAAIGRPTQRQAMSAAAILALAYPDRIGKARGAPGHFVLANGRGVRLEETDPLARSPFIVAAELTGTAAAGRVMLGAGLELPEVEAIAGDRITADDEMSFDEASGNVRCRRVTRLEAIVLNAEPRRAQPGEACERALLAGLVGCGLDKLPWSKAQLGLLQRVQFLRTVGGEGWPDLSFEALGTTAQDWLLPFLAGKTSASDVTADELGHALGQCLGGDLSRRVEAEAPSHFEAPTGNRFSIDYAGGNAPSVAIRVQELFGLKTHPMIGRPPRPLTFELLSPAYRPIQITRDLPGFWRGSWAAVRAEMRGRYPKHVWPEDPAGAAPTTRAKPRPGGSGR